MSEQPVMIVTGATNGIGEAAAIELARRTAHVGIVARNPRKAEATVARMATAAPGASVDVFLGDLALMNDVRRVASELSDRYERIDVLVNNAGIQLPEQRTTSEGLPEMVAVNYLAPWLLTSLLRARLEASAPARVVMTASEGHRIGRTIDPETILTDTSAFGRGGVMVAYGKSKLLDVLFTLELAQRLKGIGVTANCCCPGLVATGLSGTDTRADRVAKTLSATPLVRRPDQGARVLVRLAPIRSSRPGPVSSSHRPLSPACCRRYPPSATSPSGAGSGTRQRRCSPPVEPPAHRSPASARACSSAGHKDVGGGALIPKTSGVSGDAAPPPHFPKSFGGDRYGSSLSIAHGPARAGR